MKVLFCVVMKNINLLWPWFRLSVLHTQFSLSNGKCAELMGEFIFFEGAEGVLLSVTW